MYHSHTFRKKCICAPPLASSMLNVSRSRKRKQPISNSWMTLLIFLLCTQTYAEKKKEKERKERKIKSTVALPVEREQFCNGPGLLLFYTFPLSVHILQSPNIEGM